MSRTKFFLSLTVVVSILMIQTGAVFAAPVLQTAPSLMGAVQTITIETYSTTAITIVTVTVMDSNQVFRTARVNEKTAMDLGLVMLDGDGKLVINNSALGQSIEIEPKMVIPAQEEDRHPVGNALATFFSNIAGLNYDMIMLAHNDGMGFGTIAQALWLTTRLEGNAEVFQSLLLAKDTGDFNEFTLDDGTTPKNWAELRKALFEGKRVSNLGDIMSNQDNNGNGNNPDQDPAKENNKDKEKNKDNGGSINGNGNNGEKDKEKNKP